MKTYQKKIISRFIIIGWVVVLLSCDKDFLDLENPNDITAATFFETQEQVQQAVNTLYPALVGVRLSENGGVFQQNSRSGESQITAGAFDIQVSYYNFQNTPESGSTDALWESLYTMIYRANTILANMDRVEWSGGEEIQTNLTAEIHFFRGLGYFYLAYLYGQVPIVTKPAETEEEFNPVKAENVGAVYDQAISDLQIAKAGLPELQEDPGRATKGAAIGFLGKTYLYRAGYLGEESFYALAAAEFKEVIEMDNYGLVSNFEDNFTAANENNEESLFELQLLFNPGLETPTQARPFNSVPGIGFEIFLRPSNWLMETMALEKTVNGEFDARYLQTVYFDGGLPLFGVPYDQLGDGIGCEGGRGVGNAPDGSSTKIGGWWRKYLNVNLSCEPILTGSEPGNNERILRYADILLMYAEALLMSGGSMAEAADALKQVRNRANLPEKTFVNGNELMEEIRHQRIMEFAYENTHYFDLIRWDLLGESLIDHGTSIQVASYDPIKHKYFPIPTSEINNNLNLDQNEAWK
jgi:tetratricopeptide (TPR) repeat protein